MTDLFKSTIRIMLAWKDLTWEWFIRLLSRTIEARRWTMKDWVKITVNLDLYTLQKYCSRIGPSIYRKQTKLRTFNHQENYLKKINFRGFSRGSVVKNPPANAGGTGLISDLGRSQSCAEQLSLCTTNTEPMHPRTCALQQVKPRQWEAHAPQLQSRPRSPQLENS